MLQRLKKGLLGIALLSAGLILTGCDEQVASVGAKAPAIAMFNAGQQFELEDYAGKAVVLEFWSATCGPCIAMMQEWQKLTDRRSQDVVVLGINIDSNELDLKAFADKQGLTFPLGFDQLGITQERYQVAVTPTTYFVNTSGKIEKMHVGYSPDMDLDGYVDALLTD